MMALVQVSATQVWQGEGGIWHSGLGTKAKSVWELVIKGPGKWHLSDAG